MAADGAEGSVKRVCLTCNAEFAGGESVCPHDGTALTPVADGSLIGTVLGGRYQILSVIGDGAMGRVYLAKHQLMKRQVAVKMMHPQLISGKAALRRFQKEAELASALNHPNILSVYDFGVTDDGNPYLVMDYLQGRELSELLAEAKRLGTSEAIHIFKQVCQGLAHAHDKGVVHRDLKPSNIMLVTLDEDQNFVKILDFGIAKQLNPSDSAMGNLTRTGEVFGTPHYMSPEQCRALHVDGRADIYAVGCVMYQTLTGDLPIRGSDLIECLYKHVNETPASFATVCPELDLPAELESIVFKAMAKAPEDRYQTFQEMRAALDVLEPDGRTGTFSRVNLNAISEAAVRTASASAINLKAVEPDSEPVNPQLVDTVSEEAHVLLDGQSLAPEIEEVKKIVKSDAELLDSILTVKKSEENQAHIEQDRQDELSTAASNKTFVSADTVQKAKSSPGQATTGSGRLIMAEKRKLVILVPVVMLLLIGVFAIFYYGGNGKYSAEIAQLQKQATEAYDLGNFVAAKKFVRQAQKVEEDHQLPKSLRTRYLLGLIFYAQGDYDDAESVLERALSMVQSSSPGSLTLAEIEVPLGRARARIKEFDGAQKVLDDAYKIRSEKLSKGDLLLADVISGQAELNMARGKTKEALSQLTEALAMITAKKGADSIEAATAQNNLGQAYQASGNLQKAEEMYQMALSARRNKLKDSSPLIADSLQCLGTLYAYTGRGKQALDCYKEAIAVQQKSLDATDPRLVNVQKKYAELLARMVGR